jgi:hypothetical protein
MLNEADTCRILITSKLHTASWDNNQIRENENGANPRIADIAIKGMSAPPPMHYQDELAEGLDRADKKEQRRNTGSRQFQDQRQKENKDEK